jgi:hypothetical protein
VSDWELVPTRVVLMPQLSSLRRGLPAAEYPSDHISLVAEFDVRRACGVPAVALPGPGAAGQTGAPEWPVPISGQQEGSGLRAAAGHAPQRGVFPPQNQHIRFNVD